MYADRYLLIILVSFSASVSLTRIFLEITGYPQLGGSELHIAHVLWGGLILFVGSLMPLVFANKRALDLSALLSGVGVGLFIDEVGKFLTRTNDYFYPVAAPIIYAFFLITLLLYILTKQNQRLSERARLFHILEQFEEVLEGDLSRIEFEEMNDHLSYLTENENDPDIARLAGNLKDILEQEEPSLVAHLPGFLENLWDRWLQFEKQHFSGRMINTWLIVVWFFSGMISISHSFLTYTFIRMDVHLSGVFGKLFDTSLDLSIGLPFTRWIRLIGEGLFGACLLVAVVAAWKGKNKFALTLAYFSLISMLLFVNIFVFYYDQFSAIAFTFLQFIILFLTMRYRNQYDWKINEKRV